MPADLLIAASIGLADVVQTPHSNDRIVASLRLGRAGAIRFAEIGTSLLAAREELPASGPNERAKVSRFEPRKCQDGSYILLAGRLQDRQQIKDSLGRQEARDDASLYAQAYAQFGNDCDRRIEGDYAVIQWFPSTGSVRLARSATSTKPLHISRSEGRLVVSSIPRALFAAGLQAEIDTNHLGDSLLLNYRDGTSSWYRNANRVACGTSQLHDQHGYKVHTHWSSRDVARVQYPSDRDYVEAVNEQFVKATRNAMDGISKPAIALSGGLDSQAVASYLCEHLGPEVTLSSYTSVPHDGWSAPHKPYSFGDESDHVRAFAAMHPQLEPRFVSGYDRQFGSELDAMHLLGSWPTRNESNMHWIHEIYAGAARMGSEVVVFGGAGNTGFSYDGQTGYPNWLRHGQWRRLASELSKVEDPRPLWRKAVSLAVMPILSPKLRRSLDHYRGGFSSAFETWCPMRHQFALESGALDRAAAIGVDPEFYDSGSALEWKSSVLADTLSETAEIDLAMQLHHGIGSRDPTLYRPLLELCIGIADDQYLRDGTDRWLARRLLNGRVPETVRTERRFGRQSPDWAMRFQRERQEMLKKLDTFSANNFLTDVFDVERLTDDLANWSGEEDSAGENKLKINSAVGRAVSTAQFIRYVQKSNDAV
ncbi:MAG: asparagine synthase-related protein [Erythrobacter sp.]